MENKKRRTKMKTKRENRVLGNTMEKSPAVYITILCVWAACSAFLLVSCGMILYDVFASTAPTWVLVTRGILLVANAVILSYMWLGSVKDFMFSFLFLLNGKKITRRYAPIINANAGGMSALKHELRK